VPSASDYTYFVFCLDVLADVVAVSNVFYRVVGRDVYVVLLLSVRLSCLWVWVCVFLLLWCRTVIQLSPLRAILGRRSP